MIDQPRRYISISVVLSLLVLTACATFPEHPELYNSVAFTFPESGTLLSRHAPTFVVENPGALHNLIGTPTAKTDGDDKESIEVDPFRATVYTETRRFDTSKGSYTNLIYRVHFPEIPGGLLPYYLGKGKNVGLIVVITLDSTNKPMLCTTVHTCGCYLAFVPTSHLPDDALPDGWNEAGQTVHSETLPGRLDFSGEGAEAGGRLMVLLRDGTHRVKDIWLAPLKNLPDYPRIKAEIAPLAALEALPIAGGQTTSFYETTGPRSGYVKGSEKARERLFMSWWALDWRIGEDKKLGTDIKDGTPFYTSLKPWARDASDMRDFARFLSYWGWRL